MVVNSRTSINSQHGLVVCPYYVLGLPCYSHVTKETLKSAKRLALKKYHPDKNSGSSCSSVKQTTFLFHNIIASFDFLSNSLFKHKYDVELMEHDKECAKEAAIEMEEKSNEVKKRVMEEKRIARKAVQQTYGQGKKNKKAYNVIKCVRFVNQAKEEKMANDAQRAQREVEMSAVHKRARKVREQSKKFQCRAEVETATERGYVEREPQKICGGGNEPAVVREGDIVDMVSTLVVAAQAVSLDDIGAGHDNLSLLLHEERPQDPCLEPFQLWESLIDFDVANEASVAADMANALAADLLVAGISLEHTSVHDNGWNINLNQGEVDWPAIERDLGRGTFLFTSPYVDSGPQKIRGRGDGAAVEQEGDIGDMISTLVVAAQAEEVNNVEAPPPIEGSRQPSDASTFMESSSGMTQENDLALFAEAIQVLPAAESNDPNFGGVPLLVPEPLLPPHASTVTGVSLEAHPVKDLFGDDEDSIKVHGVETRPPISSRAELVDVSADLITVEAVQTRPPTASGAEFVDESAIYGNLYNNFHGDDDINDHDHSVLDELEDDELVDVVNGVICDQSLGESHNDFNETLAYILAHNAVPNDIVVPEGLTEDNLCIAKETVKHYRHNDEHKDKDALLKSIQEFTFFNSFTGRRTSTNAWRCSLSTNSNATKKGRNEVGNERLIEHL